MLYTGVVKKPAELVRPDACPQHESQLMAVATDPGEETKARKDDQQAFI
jgi:hypothetical protein